VSAKYNPGQIFYDGNFLYGCLMLYLYITEQSANQTFSTKYFIISNIQQILGILATSCLTFGLKYGKGGTVQAIEQVKSIFQTCWAAIFLGQIPIVSQWLGMLVGIAGIIIIVLQPRKDEEIEEKETPSNESK